MEREQVDKILRSIKELDDSINSCFVLCFCIIYFFMGIVLADIYTIQNPKELDRAKSIGKVLTVFMWPVYIGDVTSAIYTEWRASLTVERRYK